MSDPATNYRPEDWHAIRALNGYRWLVATAASVVFFTGVTEHLFDVLWPELFGIACVAYLILCLPSAWAAHRRSPALNRQVYLLIGTDIAFVLALVLASGGVRDGLAVLLFAPIAGASMMVQPRMAALFAAVASLGLLAEEGWRYLRYPGDTAEWAQAGILGVLLFVAAIVASTLAQRARANAALAVQRKSELDDMAALNERIIQQMSIGLLVVDAQRRIRVINRAARDMLGLGPDAVGRSLPLAVPLLAQALKTWLISPGLSPKPFTMAERSLIPRFNRLGHGLEAPVLVFLEDARRISEQAQQIKLAALGRLTASIAHEIRNPLSAISHAGQLLDESERIGDDERKLLSILHRHTRRIDDIVQSVLGLSRRGRTLPARFALRPWLEQCAADYRNSRRDPARITIDRVPEDLEVQADTDQLEQVLMNLCDNAERHARTGDRALEIRLSASVTEDGQPYLDVADNGPGISRETSGNLMEPFFTTDHEGTGLGLYIARELCECNFASIALVDSGQGACFRITFARPDELERAVAAQGSDVAVS